MDYAERLALDVHCELRGESLLFPPRGHVFLDGSHIAARSPGEPFPDFLRRAVGTGLRRCPQADRCSTCFADRPPSLFSS